MNEQLRFSSDISTTTAQIVSRERLAAHVTAAEDLGESVRVEVFDFSTTEQKIAFAGIYAAREAYLSAFPAPRGAPISKERPRSAAQIRSQVVQPAAKDGAMGIVVRYNSRAIGDYWRRVAELSQD